MRARGGAPKAIDVFVGQKIRVRRKSLSLSQSDLATKIGVSFQQLQKYESGMNRVGASRLAGLAEALKVPVGYFFPDDNTAMPKATNVAERIADLELRLKEILKELGQLRKLL